MKKILIVLTILFTSAHQVYAGSPLTIKAEIYSGEKLLGNPIIVVNQNTESSIAVDNKFKLTLNASETKDKNIFIKTNIEIEEERESHSPSLLVERGKKAEVIIGTTTLTLLVAK